MRRLLRGTTRFKTLDSLHMQGYVNLARGMFMCAVKMARRRTLQSATWIGAWFGHELNEKSGHPSSIVNVVCLLELL